jgi:glutathione S-transferase
LKEVESKESAMSEFVVHTIPGSPFARSVLATLEEKGAPYRLAPVPQGTLQSPEHLARHPFGRIPVLKHGEFWLYETQAILRYLDRVLPHRPLTPADAKRAARMDQVMNVNDWYLFHGVANVIVFHRIVAPQLMGQAPDEAAIAAAMPKARTVFNELARLLGGQSWFAGDALSLADLLLGPAVAFFTTTPEWAELCVPHANLVAWLERFEARPCMKATTWERVSAMAKGRLTRRGRSARSLDFYCGRLIWIRVIQLGDRLRAASDQRRRQVDRYPPPGRRGG